MGAVEEVSIGLVAAGPSSRNDWPLPQPLPRREGSEMWGYPYWPACMGCYEVFLLCMGVFSLTDLTDLTEPLCAQFRAHRRPSAYRYHRALLLMKIPIRRQKVAFLLCMGVFSLTDLTDLTEPLCAQFRTHRTPLAYRYHRTLQLKVAVRFCEIGWLNVSVECCVFCSSVFFCEK